MIFFLIPVFNEEQNIERLSMALKSVCTNEDHFFVFSDDGSTDSTKEKIETFFTDTRYVLLGDGVNRGPGAAFNFGFSWILANHSSELDTVVTLEADGTSDLSILPEMLMLSKMKYDLVLASVYAQGGGFTKTTLFRRIASALANLIFRFAFNVQVLTLSSFFRVYRVSLLRALQAKHANNLISENGFICMLEILLKAIHVQAKIIEVPMRLDSSKRQGKSKMRVAKTMLQYFAFLAKSKKYR